MGVVIPLEEKAKSEAKGGVEKLVSLAENPFQPVIRLGAHRCQFCDLLPGSAGHCIIEVLDRKLQVGIYNYFIPYQSNKIFVAPSLIHHYITSHNYCPPEKFQRAVIDCPAMDSAEYLQKVSEVGLLKIPPSRQHG